MQQSEQPSILQEGNYPASDCLFEAKPVDSVLKITDTTMAKDPFLTGCQEEGPGSDWFAANQVFRERLLSHRMGVRHHYTACLDSAN